MVLTLLLREIESARSPVTLGGTLPERLILAASVIKANTKAAAHHFPVTHVRQAGMPTTRAPRSASNVPSATVVPLLTVSLCLAVVGRLQTRQDKWNAKFALKEALLFTKQALRPMIAGVKIYQKSRPSMQMVPQYASARPTRLKYQGCAAPKGLTLLQEGPCKLRSNALPATVAAILQLHPSRVLLGSTPSETPSGVSLARLGTIAPAGLVLRPVPPDSSVLLGRSL